MMHPVKLLFPLFLIIWGCAAPTINVPQPFDGLPLISYRAVTDGREELFKTWPEVVFSTHTNIWAKSCHRDTLELVLIDNRYLGRYLRLVGPILHEQCNWRNGNYVFEDQLGTTHRVEIVREGSFDWQKRDAIILLDGEVLYCFGGKSQACE